MLGVLCYSGRGAAGSAPGLGPGGRTFESCRPDYNEVYKDDSSFPTHRFGDDGACYRLSKHRARQYASF